jgi:multidrug efflux pump subunit AcrB
MAADQYSPLIVAYRNGQPARLRDLGTVTDSVENDIHADDSSRGRSR